MWYSSDWKEYELLDAADGQRLERWGKYVFVRPDPQAVWGEKSNNPLWKKALVIWVCLLILLATFLKPSA